MSPNINWNNRYDNPITQAAAHGDIASCFEDKPNTFGEASLAVIAGLQAALGDAQPAVGDLTELTRHAQEQLNRQLLARLTGAETSNVVNIYANMVGDKLREIAQRVRPDISVGELDAVTENFFTAMHDQFGKTGEIFAGLAKAKSSEIAKS